MAHILEEFAKLCNVSPGKPKLVEHFFPIPFDKYIVLSCSTEEESMSYPYWQDVLDLIQLPLELNNFRVVQIIEGKSPPIPEADVSLGVLTHQQKAYVLSHASAFVGSSGLLAHMASAYNVKTVSLHAKYFIENNKPYWSTEDISLEGRDKQKPTFEKNDPTLSIKKIKPEEIATALLKILNINQSIIHKSLHIGEHYPVNVVEVNPNFFNPNIIGQDQPVNLRLDWTNDVKHASYWVQTRKVNIFANKELNLDFIKNFKKNINLINLFINENTQHEYIKAIESTGVKFKLYFKDESKISDIRIKFIDWIINQYQLPQKKDLDNIDQICDNSHYKSSKIILSNNQIYASKAAMISNIPQSEDAQKIIDCDELWGDMQHLYIFNK